MRIACRAWLSLHISSRPTTAHEHDATGNLFNHLANKIGTIGYSITSLAPVWANFGKIVRRLGRSCKQALRCPRRGLLGTHFLLVPNISQTCNWHLFFWKSWGRLGGALGDPAIKRCAVPDPPALLQAISAEFGPDVKTRRELFGTLLLVFFVWGIASD